MQPWVGQEPPWEIPNLWSTGKGENFCLGRKEPVLGGDWGAPPLCLPDRDVPAPLTSPSFRIWDAPSQLNPFTSQKPRPPGCVNKSTIALLVPNALQSQQAQSSRFKVYTAYELGG